MCNCFSVIDGETIQIEWNIFPGHWRVCKRFKKNESLSKQVQVNLKIGSYSCLERKFKIMFFRIQLKRRISRKDFNWDSDHSLVKKKENKDMERTDILLKESGILL